ncbi:MAG: monovalent cation/H+ antiporter subunit D family protein [Desulfohalobiaceae bacterium]
METIISVKPLLAILYSLLAVPLIILCRRVPNIRESWTFVAAFSKLAVILAMLPGVLSGTVYSFTIAQVLPGVPIALRVDALGMLFALVASSLWIVTSLYSIGYMRAENEHSQTRYFSFFALALSATIGVAFSANLLTLYLFYEMLSFATYPLVTHHQDQESRISGRKYLAFIVGTSIGLVLPAMLIIYNMTGTLDFGPEGILAAGEHSATVIALLLFMFVFGFAKVGIMPFHAWLPAAMVAPTPVSALLHAVAVVKVGAFSVVRVITGIFGVGMLSSLNLGLVIGAVASVTILLASLIALTQDNLKRRLAFSTIGQLSYIVLGVALLSPRGMTGGMVHIAMHAFGKITLFMCAGAIFVAAGKKYVSQLDGIGRRMPVTMLAFFIGSLSVIGLPPCGGFISKWYLLLGSLESGHTAFVLVLLGSSFLNTVYFMPIVYRAFFKAPQGEDAATGFAEAPVLCTAPLVLTAASSVVLLFYPQPFLRLAEMAVAGLIGG